MRATDVRPIVGSAPNTIAHRVPRPCSSFLRMWVHMSRVGFDNWIPTLRGSLIWMR